jgi:hypothetical protein
MPETLDKSDLLNPYAHSFPDWEPGSMQPLFTAMYKDPLNCTICGHGIRNHEKYTRSGALAERCVAVRVTIIPSLGRQIKQPCKCPGYQPPRPKWYEWRCTVCKKGFFWSRDRKSGMESCKFCGAKFGIGTMFGIQQMLRK